MRTLFSKEKQPAPAPQATHCSGCGCTIESHHWRNCPRCQQEIPDSGCRGCGNCGH